MGPVASGLINLRQQIVEVGDAVFADAAAGAVGHDAPLAAIAARFEAFCTLSTSRKSSGRNTSRYQSISLSCSSLKSALVK